MALFSEEIRSQLTQILSQLDQPLKIVYFTQQMECGSCSDVHGFYREVVDLSPKLSLDVHDFVADQDAVRRLAIDKVPAAALLQASGEDTGIRFYGLPGGYEINSFLAALIQASGRLAPLPGNLAERVAAIDRDVRLQVFVSQGCPHCPDAVIAAHRLALANRHIRGEMVETSTFVPLAIRYQVSAVPMTVVNETQTLLGAQPIDELVAAVEKAAAVV